MRHPTEQVTVQALQSLQSAQNATSAKVQPLDTTQIFLIKIDDKNILSVWLSNQLY